MVAASGAPATTAEAANAISAASVRSTASGYAHQDERERQEDDRSRQRLQRLFRSASQCVRVERIGSPILPLDANALTRTPEQALQALTDRKSTRLNSSH